MGDPLSERGPAPVGAKASPVRLVVLLAILAIMVGALGFDLLVAKPGMEAAHAKLEQEATRRISSGLGAKSAAEHSDRLKEGLLDNVAVQKILNKTPAKVEVNVERAGEEYIVETYRYWGYVPLNRHYLTVVYRGKAPNLRYSTHFRNSPPPADQLPGFQRKIAEDPIAPPGATEGGATVPGGKMTGGKMAGGGKGKGKGKGKGGGGGPGLPPPGESAPAEVTPIAEGAPVTEVPTKASAAKDGAKPGEEKPATDKPATDKPATDKPAEGKPAEEKPAESKDGDSKKAEGDKPAAEKKDGDAKNEVGDKSAEEKKADE